MEQYRTDHIRMTEIKIVASYINYKVPFSFSFPSLLYFFLCFSVFTLTYLHFRCACCFLHWETPRRRCSSFRDTRASTNSHSHYPNQTVNMSIGLGLQESMSSSLSSYPSPNKKRTIRKEEERSGSNLQIIRRYQVFGELLCIFHQHALHTKGIYHPGFYFGAAAKYAMDRKKAAKKYIEVSGIAGEERRGEEKEHLHIIFTLQTSHSEENMKRQPLPSQSALTSTTWSMLVNLLSQCLIP